jgi:hypothetical protein
VLTVEKDKRIRGRKNRKKKKRSNKPSETPEKANLNN